MSAESAEDHSGTVYVFRTKRADRVKLLVWDGSRLVLATKRLEASQSCWPKIEDGVVRLSAAQLAALVEGLDWKRVHAARYASVPRAAGLAERLAYELHRSGKSLANLF